MRLALLALACGTAISVTGVGLMTYAVTSYLEVSTVRLVGELCVLCSEGGVVGVGT